MIDRYVFDCERMKYQNTGLFHYCLQLGKHLQQQIIKDKEQLSFFLTPKADRYFGANAQYIHQHSLRKFFMPPLGSHHLWHATFQNTMYMPRRNQQIKVVMTLHDLNFMYEKSNEAKQKDYLGRLQNNVDRCSAIVCISEYVKQDLLRFCKIDKQSLHIIYNGANALASPAFHVESYTPHRPFLFAIGVINKKKNYHVLLPMMVLLPEMELVIAGRKDDAEYFQFLEQSIQQLGLENRVHILHDIDEQEKAWYYHHCTAMVMPSIAEGFGLPVIEAMSAGKPVFLSTATALPEIGGDMAYYFKSFEADEMKQVVLEGLHHYKVNNRKNLIEEHSKNFSWQHAAAQYLHIYRAVLAG